MTLKKKLPDVKRISLTSRPVEVRVESGEQVYFLKIWRNGSLQIRPKGARKPEAAATTTVHSVYRHTLWAIARGTVRRKPISRGMLATERRGGI